MGERADDVQVLHLHGCLCIEVNFALSLHLRWYLKYG